MDHAPQARGRTATSTMYLQIYAPGRQRADCIAATLPHIREEVPVVIVFRALGFVTDKDILSHIVYDLRVRACLSVGWGVCVCVSPVSPRHFVVHTTKQDEEMLDKFRASLEEAEVVKDRNLALDFIGKRGSIENAGRVRAWRLGCAAGLSSPVATIMILLSPKNNPSGHTHTHVIPLHCTAMHCDRRSASSTPS